MSKQKLQYSSDEKLAAMNHGEELYLDMNESLKFADGNVPERVEYLRRHLLDALGILTASYPRDDWPDERKAKLTDLVRWCHAYRNELRIFIHEHKGHDCSDARLVQRMITDEVFGASGVAH